jgi:hypothetical protein
MKLLQFSYTVLLVLSACAPALETQATLATTAVSTTAVAWTATPSPTASFTPTALPTASSTPSVTQTPSITPTETITSTPTFTFPSVTVNKQAHCRYGPAVAYLHAADLYPGDTGTVRGRFPYSSWLYIKFDKLNYFCWAAPSLVDVAGDISAIAFKKDLNLQSIGSNQYGPPPGVTAVRDGDEVTISWEQVEMTKDKDRGYLIEAFVCQDGAYLWWTFSYPDQYTTSYTVRDEAGCPEPSSGLLYTVEKHGFSEPVEIPWPTP